MWVLCVGIQVFGLGDNDEDTHSQAWMIGLSTNYQQCGESTWSINCYPHSVTLAIVLVLFVLAVAFLLCSLPRSLICFSPYGNRRSKPSGSPFSCTHTHNPHTHNRRVFLGKTECYFFITMIGGFSTEGGKPPITAHTNNLCRVHGGDNTLCSFLQRRGRFLSYQHTGSSLQGYSWLPPSNGSASHSAMGVSSFIHLTPRESVFCPSCGTHQVWI